MRHSIAILPLLLAFLPGLAQVAAPPKPEDLKMAGECSAIGYVVTQNRAGFPKTWQELALPLMMSPTVLAGGPELPFKDDPVYLKAANDVLDAWRKSATAEDFGKDYAEKTNACASWVGKLVQQRTGAP